MNDNIIVFNNVLSSVAKHVCLLMFLPTILDRQGSCPDTKFCQKWESLLMTTYYWTGFHVLTRGFSENGSPCCDTPPHKNWSHIFSNEENESYFHRCR